MHLIKRTLLILSLSLPSLAVAASLTDVHFITIAAKDARAVIKGADGKLAVIKPGDSIADGVKVKEITAGRIVLEETTVQGVETVFVKLANGKSTFERVRKTPEKASLLVTPPSDQR